MLLTREFSIDLAERAEQDGESLVIDLAMASEVPVERWYGQEVLRIRKDTVRLDRLNDGANLLFNHNWDDLRGVHVKGATRVDADHVIRGKVRIEGETAKGKETTALVRGGYLTKSSVGYRIHRVIEKRTGADGKEVCREIPGDVFVRAIQRCESSGDLTTRAFANELRRAVPNYEARDSDTSPTYEVIDFEPFENSLVTVPADTSVGVGRSAPVIPISTPAITATTQGGTKVSDESNAAAGASADDKTVITGGDNSRSGPNAVQMEQMRKKAIENFAKANRIEGRTVDYWINSGISLDQVSDDILKILEERGKTNPQSASALGLSRKEAEQFSLTRAIKASAENNWSNAPFELECSRSVASRLGKTNDAQKFFVPFEVLQRAMPDSGRRDLNTTLPSGGGYLVATDSVGFVELLRNRSVVFALGARRLSGLVGNVSIPKQTGSATAYWLGTETSTLTESQQTFQQLAMTPKTAGAYTEISRNLLLQSSPAAEGIVNEDLAKTVGIAVDLAALAGSGVAGQPIGLTNTSGIGSVTGTSFSYAKALEFQTDVAAANVVPARGAYLTTPAAAAILMQKQRFTSTDTPLWMGNVWDGTVCGFPAMSTNQISDGMFFGDWNELVIGEWGVLEVEVNPYANFTAGIIGIRAMYSMDVGVRRPAAFSYASSITA